jgi:hypothetical protein
MLTKMDVVSAARKSHAEWLGTRCDSRFQNVHARPPSVVVPSTNDIAQVNPIIRSQSMLQLRKRISETVARKRLKYLYKYFLFPVRAVVEVIIYF